MTPQKFGPLLKERFNGVLAEDGAGAEDLVLGWSSARADGTPFTVAALFFLAGSIPLSFLPMEPPDYDREVWEAGIALWCTP